MEQHRVAALQAFDRQRLLEQVLGGEALEHHGRTGLEADVIGQFAHALGGHHAHFAVAAGRLAGVGGAVTGAQVGHALTHGLDHARTLHADACGHGQRVQAGAVVHVDEIEPDGVVADADLAGAWLAHGHIDDLQFFGAAGLADLDG